MSFLGNRVRVGIVAAAVSLLAGVGSSAQETPASSDNGGPARSQAAMAQPGAPPALAPSAAELTQPADGSRRAGLAAEAYAVVPGTRVLVRLEENLGTGDSKEGRPFNVRTLEPMAAGSGVYLPSGAEIRGTSAGCNPQV